MKRARMIRPPLVRWLFMASVGSSRPVRGEINSRTGKIKFNSIAGHLHLDPATLSKRNVSRFRRQCRRAAS